MVKASLIRVNPELSIPEKEFWFRASRSGGPGGQNVNKVNTRVTLFFDVQNSPTLSALQKDRIKSRLANRLSRKGVLRLVCQRHRSQAANRREASQRLASLLEEALCVPRNRRPSRRPARANRRRLEEKRRHSLVRRSRSRPASDED